MKLLRYLVSVSPTSEPLLNLKLVNTNVRAPERFQAMLKQRRIWAEEEGLNADAIEKMYQDLVNHFIDEEMKHWQQSKIE